MKRDDESDLKHAFEELHRRQREQAPPFEAMRDRAIRGTHVRRLSPNRWAGFRWLGWAAATACMAATATWWIGRAPEPAPSDPSREESIQRVDELLTTVEQQVDLNAAIFSPDYPTDVLL